MTPRWDLFLDLHCFYPRFLDFHHLTFFARNAAHSTPFTYPAPAALVYEFFFRLPNPVLSFLGITGIFALIAADMFVKALKRQGIAAYPAIAFGLICLCCSWPLIVAYYVENIEIVVSIFLGFGLYFFVVSRSWPSAVLIGIAAAIKLFPFVFLVLFFQKKQFKHSLR